MTVLPVGGAARRPGPPMEQSEDFGAGVHGLLGRVAEVAEQVVTLLVLGLMVVAGSVIAVVVVGVMAGYIH